MTTLQQHFLADRFAQIATQIGHAQRKPASWMHDTTWALHEANAKRLADKGVEMTDDHARQVAVKRAKQT